MHTRVRVVSGEQFALRVSRCERLTDRSMSVAGRDSSRYQAIGNVCCNGVPFSGSRGHRATIEARIFKRDAKGFQRCFGPFDRHDRESLGLLQVTMI